MNIDVVNPANGRVISSYTPMTREEVADIAERCAVAAVGWRATTFVQRTSVLRGAAELLRERSVELARIMAEEMGKPVGEGRAEAEKCAWVCDYYAANAERFLADEIVETDSQRSYISYRPLGVVLAVMPWNFPLWQVFRFAAPTLMAGNGALLKHASNVPGSALAIESILHAAGVPHDLFRTLLIGSSQVTHVIAHPAVSAVTLTGSTPAGRSVAARAGECLKKTVLELGGSDPYIILDDADIDMAATICAKSRLTNSGQSCIAAKRFIAVDAVCDRFTELMIERMQEARMGDPLDETTTIGPQARIDLRDELHDQVNRSIAAGARLLLGGEIPDKNGAWYPPTLLADVRPGMAAFDEELFGPVAAVIRAQGEEEAIRLANRSQFGLGAAVFTSNIERGEQIAANHLDAGSCFVNALVKSDPRLPFGGIRQSGYGRELGVFGIREFVNVKTVCVA